MGALSRFDAGCLAIKLVSTRGPPPFLDGLVQLDSVGKSNDRSENIQNGMCGSIELLA